MIYNIDNSLEDNGIIFFTTDSGTTYKISMTEFDSSLIINMVKVSNNTSDGEIFKTLSTLKHILIKNKSTGFIFIFDDRNDLIIQRKINILIRSFEDDFEYTIQKNPHIEIPGYGKYINNETRLILKQKIKKIIKFCPNCGTENNDYKFCPSCGTNLLV